MLIPIGMVKTISTSTINDKPYTQINLDNDQTIFVENGYTITAIDDQHNHTGQPCLLIEL